MSHTLILLADDDAVVRLVTCKALEQAGFDVTLAENGHEAVEQSSTHADRLAAVLLDQEMPGLTGAQAAHEIRRSNPKLPLILLSGSSPRELATRIPLEIFSDVVHKPYRPDELIARVKQVAVR